MHAALTFFGVLYVAFRCIAQLILKDLIAKANHQDIHLSP